MDTVIKVLIITNIPSPYRVDYFSYLQTHYKKYKFDILYASCSESNREWDICKEKMNNAHFLKSKTLCIRKKMDFKYIHIPIRVKKTLSALSPNIIIAMEYNPTAVQAMCWCKRNSVPYISWTDGTLHSERNINKIQRWTRHYIIKNANAFIASSTKSQEAQIAYGAEKSRCYISYLTVDIDDYITNAGDKKKERILFVGRLVPLKGVELLISALSKVTYDYEMIIVGTGPEKENLERQCRELNIYDRVCFVGYKNREELKELYQSSSIFILPTKDDCFALVVLEAMCSGMPIICSQYADGIYDLIEDGKQGYIINPYDAGTFADKINELLKNRNLSKAMGEAAFKRIDKFRFSEVSKPFIKAIESVCYSSRI